MPLLLLPYVVAEEHAENIILLILPIGLLLLLLMTILLIRLLFSAPFIIDGLLLWVAETLENLVDLLEGFLRSGGVVLIGVHFKGSLLVGFLDFIIRCSLFNG